jgi:cytochrome c peroxidase
MKHLGWVALGLFSFVASACSPKIDTAVAAEEDCGDDCPLASSSQSSREDQQLPPPPPPPPAMCGDMNGGGDQHVDFQALLAMKSAAKPGEMMRQLAHLNDRYELANNPSVTTMFRGKPLQQGVRVRLPAGFRSWEALARLSPADIKSQDVFPLGFFPLPHVNQLEGGMLFPQSTIDELLAQTGRDLTRFDLDFDIPEHFLAEFPPAMFLTTRPDLGDVSQGQMITSHNYFELFKCILNPKQLDGLRLLLTPFPQQQFNLIDDRRSHDPSLGVACLDCHVNGHTNGATHLVGDIRPQEMRHRIDTVSLRGLNVQEVFGSQRALSSVEDFTEFEQAAAYFDGDPVLAEKKGVNFLDRLRQVHHMAEMQNILDFPPAPKLGLDGKLNPDLATRKEMRGQELFFGKAQCGSCHPAPYYTDNTLHNLQLDRFFEPRHVNGILANDEGPIKTFTLRGLKDSPPYFHDGRLLTLEDTIEFFNLILGTELTAAEKRDLYAFLLVL